MFTTETGSKSHLDGVRQVRFSRPVTAGGRLNVASTEYGSPLFRPRSTTQLLGASTSRARLFQTSWSWSRSTPCTSVRKLCVSSYKFVTYVWMQSTTTRSWTGARPQSLEKRPILAHCISIGCSCSSVAGETEGCRSG